MPLTPNQRIVQTLFWDDRAKDWLDTWGLTQADAESIILADTKPTLDPHSGEAGHPIVRFRRGDVTVIVGLREKERPKVLSVFIHIPGWDTNKGTGNPGTGAGTSLPTSNKQLRRWIIDFGYRIEASAHDRVLDKTTGKFVMALPNTPSDSRSLANTWRSFLKAHARNHATNVANRRQT